MEQWREGGGRIDLLVGRAVLIDVSRLVGRAEGEMRQHIGKRTWSPDG